MSLIDTEIDSSKQINGTDWFKILCSTIFQVAILNMNCDLFASTLKIMEMSNTHHKTEPNRTYDLFNLSVRFTKIHLMNKTFDESVSFDWDCYLVYCMHLLGTDTYYCLWYSHPRSQFKLKCSGRCLIFNQVRQNVNSTFKFFCVLLLTPSF